MATYQAIKDINDNTTWHIYKKVFFRVWVNTHYSFSAKDVEEANAIMADIVARMNQKTMEFEVE